MNTDTRKGSIAIIGGTGIEGAGLAIRFSIAGRPVIIGSRSLSKAASAAEGIRKALPQADVTGALNPQAAASAELVFVTVPYYAISDVAAALNGLVDGKVVVTPIVPVMLINGKAQSLPVRGGSAARELQELLPEAKVVAAFHTISAKDLMLPDTPLACDVPVCSDYQEAKEEVMALAQCVEGVRAIDGGPLENSRYIEGITTFLLNVNRIYGGVRSGIRITGI